MLSIERRQGCPLVAVRMNDLAHREPEDQADACTRGEGTEDLQHVHPSLIKDRLPRPSAGASLQSV
ncbi:hypothetical protein GXB85_00740 [Cellulomonas sp. APG4]|uniref:hypothetical protein n=1 Tax=Cellulomonadaceae TaxID=85016 RepID=UPI001377D0CF|nr:MULTISPECIES: hypothetical protein [Cellulomonadaceae]MDT0166653.1 hypothetical protein [Actinotalea sp. AC32]NCT89485.1 hypothetical protein [Cellulomonas sp. APG4]